jgi:hypothetical protein
LLDGRSKRRSFNDSDEEERPAIKLAAPTTGGRRQAVK